MTSDETTARILDVSGRFAASLSPRDLDATLGSITSAAVRLLPQVSYASITTVHRDDRIDSHAITDEVLRELDAKQAEWREGPCYDGAAHEPHVVSGDLRNDARYPRYGPLAADAGVRSQAGLRLYENSRAVSALNLYSRSVGAFADLSPLDRLFADQAAVAISYANEVNDLKQALRTRTVIGQATGLVMERFGLSDDRAFAFLTRLSSHRNVKLRVIAEEIVAAARTESQGRP